jgi:hypothetical protein
MTNIMGLAVIVPPSSSAANSAHLRYIASQNASLPILAGPRRGYPLHVE